MKNIIYDNQFNLNEWTCIGFIVIGFAFYFSLPKLLSHSATTINMLFGIVTGLMFDHTIAIQPLDLYDVGDEAKYQWFDLFSYTMYAPFGYIFIYFYIYWKLASRRAWTILYVVCWSLLGVGVEWIGVHTGIFHYKRGYEITYSFPIYLYVQSLHLWFFQYLFMKK